MTVIVLHNYPPALAGKVSRWMMQISAGVFVGQLTARGRDKVVNLLSTHTNGVDGVMCCTDDSIQGLRVTKFGNPTYSLEDFDGVALIVKPLRGCKREK